jgi:hypothetical protein
MGLDSFLAQRLQLCSLLLIESRANAVEEEGAFASTQLHLTSPANFHPTHSVSLLWSLACSATKAWVVAMETFMPQ